MTKQLKGPAGGAKSGQTVPLESTGAYLRHGVDCEKITHIGAGYLHGEDDDSPFDVDHIKYCGRCHQALP